MKNWNRLVPVPVPAAAVASEEELGSVPWCASCLGRSLKQRARRQRRRTCLAGAEDGVDEGGLQELLAVPDEGSPIGAAESR